MVYEQIDIKTVEEPDGETLLIKGYANRYMKDDGTIVVDDWGTTFEPLSFNLETFKNNPVLLNNHDNSKPIGRVTVIEKRETGLYIEALVFKGSDETAYFNIKNKVMTCFSVGVDIKKEHWSDLLSAYVIVSAELVEISVVAIPSNTASFIEEVSLCSFGVCSVIRGKRPPTKRTTSKFDKIIITQMVKKILNESKH
jgi:HK97 family phage prohead protease